jgi:ferredoxin
MRIEEVRDEGRNERVMDMNCTFCLECIENCPEKALKLSMAKKNIYRGGRDWWKRRGTKPQDEFEGSVPEDDIGK